VTGVHVHGLGLLLLLLLRLRPTRSKEKNLVGLLGLFCWSSFGEWVAVSSQASQRLTGVVLVCSQAWLGPNWVLLVRAQCAVEARVWPGISAANQCYVLL
jgi:hypothetical protein